MPTPTATTSAASTSDLAFNLNDAGSRAHLWSLLKAHSSVDELKYHLGASLHDKVSFWDLVQLKLKFSPTSQHLKTTYKLIDDYTLLYSNMSSLLETIVKEHSQATQVRSAFFRFAFQLIMFD